MAFYSGDAGGGSSFESVMRRAGGNPFEILRILKEQEEAKANSSVVGDYDTLGDWAEAGPHRDALLKGFGNAPQTNFFDALRNISSSVPSGSDIRGVSAVPDFNYTARPEIEDPTANYGSPSPEERYGIVPEGTQQGRSRDRGPSEMDLWLQKLTKAATDVPVVDFDELQSENAAAIRGAYRPQIRGLRRENEEVEQETAEGQQAVRDIYGQVAKRDTRQAERALQTGNRQARDVTSQVRQAQNVSSNAYGEDVGQTAALLRRAGQNDAADEILKKASGQQADRRIVLTREGAAGRMTARDRAANMNKYFGSMAAGARLAGADAAADVLERGTDIMEENRNAIQTLKGQRGAEVANMITGLTTQEAETNVAAQQQVWDRMMDLTGIKQSMTAQELAEWQTKQGVKRDWYETLHPESTASDEPSLTDRLGKYGNAMEVIDLQWSNPDKAAQAKRILDSMRNSEDWRRGETTYRNDAGESESADLTIEERIAQAEAAARKMGWKRADIAKLRNTVQALYA